MATSKVYDYVTERIVAALEKGVVPWRKPWSAGGAAPQNFITRKPYRGMNIFLTSLAGYACPYWLSYKQAKAKGGTVRKGESATMITFWKFGKSKQLDSAGKPKPFAILRYYNVFNLEQVDGIDWLVDGGNDNDHTPIESAESIVANYATCPDITTSGDKAFYSTTRDTITIPDRKYFDRVEAYYSTLFHECAHSTGHKSRLDREMTGSFGSNTYAFEELIAEMAAGMLCGAAGIDNQTVDDSAAYIANWLSVFKNDSTFVLKAASKAQKAADHITGYEYKPEPAMTDSVQEPDRVGDSLPLSLAPYVAGKGGIVNCVD